MRKSRIQVNLTGQKIGGLTVCEYIRFDKSKKTPIQGRWKCICDCGNIVFSRTWHLQQIQKGRPGGMCKKCQTIKNQQNRKLPEILASKRELFRNYKNSCGDKNNRIFNLTFEEFEHIIRQPCFYCKNPPQCKNNTRFSKQFQCNGIDRINSEKGYVLDNVVPCCEQCNRAKLDYTLEEFTNWLIRIYDEFIIKGNKEVK